MVSLTQLLAEIESSVGRETLDGRARTLGRITGLFVASSAGYTEEQVALFDAVIQRFAAVIETRARVELAERLAPLANSPPETIAILACDEIAVARPVLAQSPRLSDQELMAIALEKGRDHMLAICDRSRLSPRVTDVLVTEGDGVVRHAVAGNPGARFSPSGAATLISHAARDEGLHQLLASRSDLSDQDARALVEIAKETARRRLMSVRPGSGRDPRQPAHHGTAHSAATGRNGSADEASLPRLDALLEGRHLSEDDLARLAGSGRMEEAVSVMASLTGLSVPSVTRIFEEKDNDLLIVVARASNWSWRTVRSLLQLRDPELTERHHFRRAEETFDSLLSDMAVRVLHFLKVRESIGHPGLSAGPEGPGRSAVRYG